VLAGRTKRNFNADATLQKDMRIVGMLILDKVCMEPVRFAEKLWLKVLFADLL
jgi:hypothetical protein